MNTTEHGDSGRTDRDLDESRPSVGRRVVVIGAGLGGLSAAIRLAAAGYRVAVYEKQSGPGGKAFSERHGAYRFDTGPSLFTLKSVFAQLFEEAGRDIDDYLDLTPLEKICNYFWRDGTRTVSYADRTAMAGEFARVFGEDPRRVERYLDYSARIHRITGHLFLEKSLHEWSTYFSTGFWSSLVQLHRIDAMRTMDRANHAFFSTPKLQQFFNRYATYNGSDPYQTPATLNIIPHVEYGLGAWAVEEGIHAVPLALERLARELGVTFHYGVRVRRINSEPAGILRRPVPARVTGVTVDDGEIGATSGEETHQAEYAGTTIEVEGSRPGRFVPADVVVSNADVTPTYEHLLEDTAAPLYQRYQKLEPSSSGLVFYWGVRYRFPELGLHNIFFSEDYEAEFRQIFREGRCPDDPTIYINITSREGAPGDAPVDGDNWFVLVNAPWDQGQDWNAEADRTRQIVLDRLSRELGRDVEELIEVELRMLPPDIAARTDSHRGSLYGISSNTRLAAFLRHPNRSRRYRGLFFVGGSAHPGGGMPLVVLGGKITADLVRRHYPPETD
jgi:diapolycopene oxygenase